MIRPDKQRIITCFKKHKLEHFNQANLDLIYRCSGFDLEHFTDLIWEMWQRDQTIYLMSGRYHPGSLMSPKRGPAWWNKTQIAILEKLRDKYPRKQSVEFQTFWPRYLVVRREYQEVTIMPKQPLFPHTQKKKEPLFPHVSKGKNETLPQTELTPSGIMAIVWKHLKCRKPKPNISFRRQHATALYWTDEHKITIREDSWRKMHPGERKLIVVHEALHACGAGHEPGYRTATDTMSMLLYKQIWGEDEDWRSFITELERRLRRFMAAPTLLPDGELLLAVEFLAQTEGDPISKFCCRFGDACAPPELLEEGKFPERIAWLRQHYKEKHPGMWGKGVLPQILVEDEGAPIPLEGRELFRHQRPLPPSAL